MWRERSTALHQLATLAPAPVPAALAGVLRPYQKLGVAWLWYLYGQKTGDAAPDTSNHFTEPFGVTSTRSTSHLPFLLLTTV